ncbi:hypothetical protein [Streptomyces sp. G-G2]|uniref:hypothetical protein n=1 Tax=Streptomyces sp. G-G2 TaxID=3046201 RepID=UPI0024BB616D|nr:hypothetical protein [Streptomyces sp. G-G2]MDJ0381315.1 hypothetical protein [Streptomyces sp. G-G2]
MRETRPTDPTREAQAVGPARPEDPAGPAPPALGAGRRVLRVVALAATAPYLALKAAWVAGSTIGIPDDSVLRDAGPILLVANSVTLAMDGCVILLVLVLTRPWGVRIPAWPLALPVFVATGLLTPILIGFPGQLLVGALGAAGGPTMPQATPRPFLDAWVFTVVYAGFTVQGLALAGLFVPYARQRWGHIWRGVPDQRLPPSTGVVAGAAAMAGLVICAAHLYWACGGSAGLGAARGAERTGDLSVVSVAHAACAFAAGAGALLLARGRSRARGGGGGGGGEGWARWPLALGWVGSAATLCWGGWMLVTSLGGQFEGEGGTTSVMYLIYAGQMITGLLAAAVLTRFLTAGPAARGSLPYAARRADRSA